METISIIEVRSALSSLFNEIKTTEGCEAYDLLCKFVAQQREKQIKDGTLIV